MIKLYVIVIIVIAIGVLLALFTPLMYKFSAWLGPVSILFIFYLIQSTLHGEEAMGLLFLIPLLAVAYIFFVTYYFKILFLFIQREKKYKALYTALVVLTWLASIIGPMFYFNIIRLPQKYVAVTTKQVPVAKYNFYTDGWISKKKEPGIYFLKIIQANETQTQKYLLYSVKEDDYEYRIVKATKAGGTMNIYVITKNATNNSYALTKQAFIIEADKEPEVINIFLDGLNIKPKN